MAEVNYERIMEKLQKERDLELECAMRSKRIMEKTFNPIRRFKRWQDYEMFMNHVRGIDLAIHLLKLEIKSVS